MSPVLDRQRGLSLVSVMRILRADESGQVIAWSLMTAVVFVLVLAILCDIYALQETRAWLYGVAADAALCGVAKGRDYATYMATGQISLDRDEARGMAEVTIEREMNRRGITSYTRQVEAFLPGDPVPSPFPPVERAHLGYGGGVSNWSPTRPSVGVYLAVPVPVFFCGLVNLSSSVTVHAFSAAEVGSVP